MPRKQALTSRLAYASTQRKTHCLRRDEREYEMGRLYIVTRKNSQKCVQFYMLTILVQLSLLDLQCKDYPSGDF